VADVSELTRLTDGVHSRDALVAVAADPMALVLLTQPGEWAPIW